MTNELNQILDLGKEHINELLEKRRKITSQMNKYFRMKNPDWINFNIALENCVKIDYALQFKPEIEKEDYILRSKEYQDWAIKTERFEWAEELKNKITQIKRYLPKSPIVYTTRQTL